MILRETPHVRRQHPGSGRSQRHPTVDLRGRAWRGLRHGRRPHPRSARPVLGRLPAAPAPLADAGYHGAGAGVHTPATKPAGRPSHAPHPDNRTYNQLLRGLRALGERAAAELTQRWHTLSHITLSPSRIGNIARAAVVLNNSWK